MGRDERLKLISRLEAVRKSTIICYVTGDRENVNTRIAPDVLPVFYRQLEQRTPKGPVELFLYTRGGDVLTPSRLIHLIREYAQTFNVLVPFRAYSAGTLICMGADRIIMTRMGELGPIDPSVVNAFNPQDPANPVARIPVTVEDVYSYLALARDIAGLRDEQAISQIFTLMVERIHPLALGNVHRNYLLIRSVANKILRLRCETCDGDQLKRIVDNLTEKLYAHNHMISRREAAEEIGLPVVHATDEEEELMWELYQQYADEMQLGEPFSPMEMLEGDSTEFEVISGLVESVERTDAFVFNGIVERRDYPEPNQVNVSIWKQGWQWLA